MKPRGFRGSESLAAVSRNLRKIIGEPITDVIADDAPRERLRAGPEQRVGIPRQVRGAGVEDEALLSEAAEGVHPPGL